MRLAALLVAFASGCAAAPAVPVEPPAKAAEPAATVASDGDPLLLSPAQRRDELHLLLEAIGSSYAHLELKRREYGLDLGKLEAQYAPELARARTWRDYERVFVELVTGFHDTHLTWRRKRGPGETRRRGERLGLDTRWVPAPGSDALVVARTWPGSDAEKKGIRPGDRVLALDGVPIEERFARWLPLRSYSRLAGARTEFAEGAWAFQRVAKAGQTAARRLRLERDGQLLELDVLPEKGARPEKAAPKITLAKVRGVPVLRVSSLLVPHAELPAQLDELARALLKESRLVVDLRGNPGGYAQSADLVATRLIGQKRLVRTLRHLLSDRSIGHHPHLRKVARDPANPGWSVATPVVLDVPPEWRRPPAPPLEIAVLTDAGCESACELLALSLAATERSLVIGEATGGASGGPIKLDLPYSHAIVRIPSWVTYDGRGRPIEGHGLEPDEIVRTTRDDVRTGRDTVLERALDRLHAP